MHVHDGRSESRSRAARWLVLVHQLPAKPHYLRVQVGRWLRALGAVGVKNSVYLLPSAAASREALREVAREIQSRGGQAFVCEAHFVAGLSDQTAEDLFREAGDREYAAIGQEARRLAALFRPRRAPTEAQRRAGSRKLGRLRERYEEVVARDLFGSAGRDATAGALSLLEDRLAGVDVAGSPVRDHATLPRGATWVTRSGVMVDRIASAWLIRRFIDPAARLKFVTGRGYKAARGEFRFDMAGAEFTHVRELCTFEVLLERFRLRDSALRCIADIVHDLDFEDGRHRRPETAGLGRMIAGMALTTPEDADRVLQGAAVLDGLYESFRKQAR